MTTASELYDFINSFAPFDSAMDFDNVGIIVGSPETASERVMLALDATPAVIREAASNGARILITHHPIIFRPLKRLSSDHPAYLAAAAGLTVLCAHTNLDIAAGGVNDLLLRQLGLTPLTATGDDCCALGLLPNAQPDQSLAVLLRDFLHCEGLRYTGRNAPIRTVAVACGAGGSSIGYAIRSHADALITGEIKHHELLLAEEADIAVFDIGHFTSEKWIVPHLTQLCAERFPQTQFQEAVSDEHGYQYCTGKGEA